MSREQIEGAYSKTIESLLQVVGISMSDHVALLGERAIDVAVSHVEDYLKLLKILREEYEKPLTANHPTCMSPLLNDSMLVHRNRLARSSKSRLNMLRNSPDGFAGNSPMEVDRQSFSCSRIEVIAEESTLLDATREMDESTNERGFLADVSDMNGTVRSRMPSFNFDQISPVSSGRSRRSIHLMPINSSIDFDEDTSSITTSRHHGPSSAGEDTDSTILVIDDEMRTPRPRRNIDDEATPKNLWNVTLRPGSNRKISEEIRREIQRSLAIDASVQ